jgi:hypothetical protein
MASGEAEWPSTEFITCSVCARGMRYVWPFSDAMEEPSNSNAEQSGATLRSS